MVVSHAFFTIPTALSLGVVVVLIATSVIASLLATPGEPGETDDTKDDAAEAAAADSREGAEEDKTHV